MGRQLAAGVAVLSAAALSSVALGMHTTVGASAQVDRTATGYSLTLRNTGTEAIRCFLVLMATGTTVTAAPSTSSWSLTITPTLAVVGFSLPGTTIAPGAGLQPGDSTQISFAATGDPIGPSPASQGMIIRLNPSNCVFTADNAVASPITGPAATTTTTTTTTSTTAPCRCAKLGATIMKVELVKPRLASSKDTLVLRLHVDWSLQCTGGTGACTGKLKFHGTVPESRGGLLVDNDVNYNATLGAKAYTVTCTGTGTCSGTHSATAVFMVAGHGTTFNADALGKSLKKITMLVDRACTGAKTPLRMVLAFGPTGALDPAKSNYSGA